MRAPATVRRLSALTRLRLQETVTAMGVKSVFLVEVVA
ncbi:Uncharacterized protein ChrSV_0985 [Chromobacterium vaccinii]|nr:Uncharacterized protein ChrSW_0985 [Chromobacterium vaccinii]QND88444.1 Uncharacterized protein ChrSV_0985 [Chromobacterium vaccinii]